jgi:serine/threonine-protein kinase
MEAAQFVRPQQPPTAQPFHQGHAAPPPYWQGGQPAGPPAWGQTGGYGPPYPPGPGSYPSQYGGGIPPRGPGNRRWWLIGGAAALVVAVIVTVIVVASSGDDSASTAATTTTPALVPATTSPQATRRSTSTPAPAPPPPPVQIDVAALPGLLLTADEIGQRMGAPGMAAQTMETKAMVAGTITPPNCAGAWGPVHEATYNGSGYTGFAAQPVNDATHKVVQAVVSFPDAGAAKAFYDKQISDWNACKFTDVSAQYNGGKPNEATLGVPGVTGDVLTLLVMSKNSETPGMQCERAMTARGNVIVDVRACTPGVGSAGFTLARDIGQKITGTR